MNRVDGTAPLGMGKVRMRAFHNSRDNEYRAPYGALPLGALVILSIDVWDTPGARVQLRTWIDGRGEGLYAMDEVPNTSETAQGNVQRYQTAFTPDAAGIIWYQFIIDAPDGTRSYYGAQEGRFGGVGMMRGWETPSFKLTVYDEELHKRLDESLPEELDRPFADALFGFLRGDLDAYYLSETLETLRENYPEESLLRPYRVFDGASCPDVMACLAGIRTQRDTSFTQEEILALGPGKLGLAKGRLWCASLLQMLLPCESAFPSPEEPGVSHAGQTTPVWDYVDSDCEAIVQNTLDLRRALPQLSGAGFSSFAVNEDVVGVWRGDDEGERACILVNRSLQDAQDVFIPMVADKVSEVISGYAVPVVDAADVGPMPEGMPTAERYAQVHLYQLGSAILFFHPEIRLQKAMEPGMGVLAHITSLPGADDDAASNGDAAPNDIAEQERKAPLAESLPQESEAEPADDPEQEIPVVARQLGTLGPAAYEFVDWLAEAGVRYWQVLPVNPTDEFGSPYAGISAFAGNANLLDGGLDALDGFEPTDAYQEFCWREADWLEPYASFMAIREIMGKGVTWQEWPERYLRFKPELVDKDKKLSKLAEKWRRLQFIFEAQWRALRAYANERGIQVVGDMPIYVSPDSADVWGCPDIFQLDKDGEPAVIAGCPPDAFATEGQVWGNPVYDWDVLAEGGYQWWLRRLERAFDLYDFVRLDHFIGFFRYFCIPSGEKATSGAYRPGPGLEFFRAAYQKFGPLPIIAEDLGAITPAIRALVAACGFPGMDIVQFVDGNDPLSGYTPRPEKVAYTGTHDNQTLVGYAADRYPDKDASEVARELCEQVASCDAPVVVFPLQDIMGLDDEARMNTPGTKKGNWAWQTTSADIESARDTLRHLAALHAALR